METIILAGCFLLCLKKEDNKLLLRSLCHFLVIGRVGMAIEQ